MREIILAETAGFCFGVNRAVSLCEDLLSKGVRIATLGEIIHNATVVERIRSLGAVIVENPVETPDGATLVIRSHGVEREVYAACETLGIQVADATCPFVSKIHSIVQKHSAAGETVLIAGDSGHPEVQGIVGHCAGPVHVFENQEELAAVLACCNLEKGCIMVAQTTFNLVKYTECAREAKKTCTNIRVFDTICSATRTRQEEAAKLAKICDVCVVIGGRNSSNTGKLYDVCSRYAQSYRVEGADDLKPDMFENARRIGVTAGASTPAPLIEEVLHSMDDMIKDMNVEAELEAEIGVEVEEEFNFEQALEDSLRLVHRGQRIEGVVTAIHPNEVVVDIGTKHTGFIPIDELSEDPTAKPEDVVQIGETVKLIVTKVQDLEGFVTLSKKRVDSEKGLEELAASVEDGTVFDAFITEAVNKGLVAVVRGIRVFIPASQATLRRGEPYEGLARTHQKIKILEVNAERRRAIGSIRAVLDIENEKLRAEFWQNIEIGKRYKGIVKSLTAYGAFIDLGGVDGMAHKSELSWNRISKPADVLSLGEEVEVYVKDFDLETKKISLGYRNEADNPWNKIQEYELGSVFEAPVVSLTAFGAFVRLLPGVDGLVHTSEMANRHVANPREIVKIGDVIQVRLIGVDLERKRISLSMKNEDGEEYNPAEPEAAEESPIAEETSAIEEAPAAEAAPVVEEAPAETEAAEE